MLLIVFAAYYLVPLVVVVLNSFRDLPDITQHGVLGLPRSLATTNWGEAWSGICIAGTCQGISPYFWNSFKMVIPATVISTATKGASSTRMPHFSTGVTST